MDAVTNFFAVAPLIVPTVLELSPLASTQAVLGPMVIMLDGPVVAGAYVDHLSVPFPVHVGIEPAVGSRVVRLKHSCSSCSLPLDWTRSAET